MRDNRLVSTQRARKLRANMTKAEIRLWLRLRTRQLLGYKFRRQHPIGPYIVDFACLSLRLIIEVDGATHSTDLQIAHDKRRTRYFTARGWRILRFFNTDIYDDLDSTIDRIAEETRNISASSACGGGVLRSLGEEGRKGTECSGENTNSAPPQSGHPASARTAPPQAEEPGNALFLQSPVAERRDA